jgi:hypothetical protein
MKANWKEYLFIFICTGSWFFFGWNAKKRQYSNQAYQNVLLTEKYLRDYQLNYYMDTVWVYDGDRLVGSHIDSINGLNHGKFIDSIILADNY